MLIVLVIKTVLLLSFEAKFLTFFPFCAGISLAMIASGFRGLKQYVKELLFAWFLFFPEDTIGFFIENFGKITVVTAKVAAYILYYFGFNVINRGNEILLSVRKTKYNEKSTL